MGMAKSGVKVPAGVRPVMARMPWNWLLISCAWVADGADEVVVEAVLADAEAVAAALWRRSRCKISPRWSRIGLLATLTFASMIT